MTLLSADKRMINLITIAWRGSWGDRQVKYTFLFFVALNFAILVKFSSVVRSFTLFLNYWRNIFNR